MDTTRDHEFIGKPWKDGGRGPEHYDCSGIIAAWLTAEYGHTAMPPSPVTLEGKDELCRKFIRKIDRRIDAHALARGTVVFFEDARGRMRHVGVCLGAGKFLHSFNPSGSQIHNGFTLVRRMGLIPCGALGIEEAEQIAAALQDRNLKGTAIVVSIVLFVIGTAISLVSSFLLAPNLSRQNRTGRYADNPLVTRNSPDLPLPDLLGDVFVAGNSPYTTLADRNQTITDATLQKLNKVVILASGPADMIVTTDGLRVNGINHSDSYFYSAGSVVGIQVNPAQTKAEAVTGTINSQSNVPSVTVYDGAHGIDVTADIRAHYDRGFPVYGFNGCAYLVFRISDTTKFPSFNIATRVRGRHCRKFDADGFVTQSVAAESLAGADGSKVRFKLAFEDIKEVTSVEVNSVAYTQIGPGNQSGNVFHVNKVKGYIEFITAPAAAATVEVDYEYYEREWSANPAMQVIYLLTETIRGRGFSEARINWERAVEARDYYDETVVYSSADGEVSGTRWDANYALDFRRPVQEHLQAILDASFSNLFMTGGKWVIKPRRGDASSVFSFDTSNILLDDEDEPGSGESTFTAELRDRNEQPNRVKLLFHDGEAFNAESEVIADDRADQDARVARLGNEGVVETNLKFLAVTRKWRGERLAKAFLAEFVGGRWGVRLRTSVKGLAIEPGDVVDVTHPAMPGWDAKEFVVENLSYDDDGRISLLLSEKIPALF